jgi:hypothetical protein
MDAPDKPKANTMAQVTYGDLTFDTDTLPAQSVAALLSRGVTHLFGSEASSKLIGKVRATIKNGVADAPDATKEEVKAWRDANPDQISAWAKEIEAEYVKALTEGTLGTRAGGPRLDPLDVEIERLAKDYVRQLLAARKISPKQYAKGAAIVIGGKSVTFDDMVGMRIARDRDNLEKAARKVLADKARKADKAREAAASATSLEDLGL